MSELIKKNWVPQYEVFHYWNKVDINLVKDIINPIEERLAEESHPKRVLTANDKANDPLYYLLDYQKYFIN